MVALSIHTKNRLVFLFVLSIFIFATFPGKGGLEGDQREILNLKDRNDNWGIVVPLFVGEWPNILGHWRFSLVLFQLSLYWIGLWLIFEKRFAISKKPLIILSQALFFLVSSIFVSQLWRDSTLLAIATFALGLIYESLRMRPRFRRTLLVTSVMLLHIAAMFKVLYGPILALYFLWVALEGNLKNKFRNIGVMLISLSLAISPFLLDRTLVNKVGLQRVYPEQQPMIFDLASNYCWGQSDQLIENAKSGLLLVIKSDFPIQSICASLKPNSWDNLHTDYSPWQFSAPIQRIVGDDNLKVTSLRNKWLKMIIDNPVDWFHVRLMYLGWTLSLSNSFVPQNASNTWDGPIGDANRMIWSLLFSVASIVDKFRLTSLLFSFLLIIFFLIKNASHEKLKNRSYFKRNSDLFFTTLSLSATTLLTMIFFVASNGRYVLPYITISYALLFRSRNLRSPIQV